MYELKFIFAVGYIALSMVALAKLINYKANIIFWPLAPVLPIIYLIGFPMFCLVEVIKDEMPVIKKMLFLLVLIYAVIKYIPNFIDFATTKLSNINPKFGTQINVMKLVWPSYKELYSDLCACNLRIL